MRRPLHFYPRAASAYVASNGTLAEARRVWHSHPQHPYGEDRDPAYRLALRGVADPLDAEFEDTARAVFGPLYADLTPEPDSIAAWAGATSVGLIEPLER